MIKKEFEYPKDIPANLDKERLYASGENSTPGERLRNLLSCIFTYFEISVDEKFLSHVDGLSDEKKQKYLDNLGKICNENLDYIKYWLNKVQ